jgi:CheY-like chemotaxis protein
MPDDKVNSKPAGETGDRDGVSLGSSSKHVLLAEDHKVNQMLATTMLENLGHTVESVVNGEEAVKAVQSRDYDVVLMDVQMPIMTGVEATIAIRKLEGECSIVPVIAMTANAMKGDREQYLAAGMDDYLSKPIIISNLAQIVLEWGSKRSGGRRQA